MNETSKTVKKQYEKFPYPPISKFALPNPFEGEDLRFEFGCALVYKEKHSHKNIRILVAGAGTLEPLVVAGMHPYAKEVVAVELSKNSLKILRSRIRLACIRNFLTRTKLAPIKLIHADLMEWEDGAFDYILASNVIHHTQYPELLIEKFTSWLKPNGVLRLVTYPKSSRVWMRATSRWLKFFNPTHETFGLVRRSKKTIRKLTKNHPIRNCFFSQPEINTKGGLIDAFFHSCENPLSPIMLGKAAVNAGLELMAETQKETSRSSLLIDLNPKLKILSRFERLQIMDDLLEICANPILWFKSGTSEKNVTQDTKIYTEGNNTNRININNNDNNNNDDDEPLVLTKGVDPGSVSLAILKMAAPVFLVPSEIFFEISLGLKNTISILGKTGVHINDIIQELKRHIGPRVCEKNRSETLSGLSIIDLPPVEHLLNLPEPWGKEEWDTLEAELKARLGIKQGLESGAEPRAELNKKIVMETTKDHEFYPSGSLAKQAEYFQLKYGPTSSLIGPFTFRR